MSGCSRAFCSCGTRSPARTRTWWTMRLRISDGNMTLLLSRTQGEWDVGPVVVQRGAVPDPLAEADLGDELLVIVVRRARVATTEVRRAVAVLVGDGHPGRAGVPAYLVDPRRRRL